MKSESTTQKGDVVILTTKTDQGKGIFKGMTGDKCELALVFLKQPISIPVIDIRIFSKADVLRTYHKRLQVAVILPDMKDIFSMDRSNVTTPALIMKISAGACPGLQSASQVVAKLMARE